MSNVPRSRLLVAAVIVALPLGAFITRAVLLTLDGHGLDVYFTTRGHPGLYLWVVVFGFVLVLALAVAAMFRLRYLREKRRGERFAASNSAVAEVLGKWRREGDS